MDTLHDKAYEEMTLIEMAQTHIDNSRYELAGLILQMAQVQATERQAAALLRIALVLEHSNGSIEGDGYLRTLIMGR